MCNSMKKFKKLAALAITIPTLLSSTNISFAMKSNRQQSAFSPSSSDNYEIIYSSQSQEEDIYTSSKPIKPPAEDKKGKKGKKSRIEEAALAITIPTLLSSTNISFAMKSPVSSDKCPSAFSPYLSNNYEIICSSQSQEIEEGVECTNPKCPTYRKGEKCARPYKKYTHKKDGKQMQGYRCTRCRKCFTLDENGKVVKKELKDCILCNEKECAVRNGVPYTRDDGKRMQQYKCNECGKTFTRQINKNAEE